MSDHKLNPKPGEVWEHPDTRNSYAIHSVTDDGWVRFVLSHLGYPIRPYPMYTMPTLRFIGMHRKVENLGHDPDGWFSNGG